MGSSETIYLRIKDPIKLEEILSHIWNQHHYYRWIGFGIIESSNAVLNELIQKGYDVEAVKDYSIYIQDKTYRKEWLIKQHEYFKRKHEEQLKKSNL